MFSSTLLSFHILFFILFTAVFAQDVQQDLVTISRRRIDTIVGLSSSQYPGIATWLQRMDAEGKFSDIDYTTGCAARRANWPAQLHWARLSIIAAAWHGGRPGADQYKKKPETRAAISLGMKYWFNRDFTNPACMDRGGTDACPCSNPDNSLWNQNWFSNVILVPSSVMETCLLLGSSLSEAELEQCKRFSSRSYNIFTTPIKTNVLTGANAVDIAQLGIDQALLTMNATLLAEAYQNARGELKVVNAIQADGIRSDGAFAQHKGVLYNGNYGKDFTNAILSIEIGAGGTSFAPSQAARSAFETLFNGHRWMIFYNNLTAVLHWDFSALGRFLAMPVAESQASASINVNLTQVAELGRLWSSPTLTNFASKLSGGFTGHANAGNLVGNRMFYTSDYMVHRGAKYISTFKMFSNRTINTECINNQNLKGLHLSDGALYTYLKGDEYEDIQAAWDWDLIPGTTVDYQATSATCDKIDQKGIESFVGGASNGTIGLAAMKFTNPINQALKFQKAVFFFEDDLQHVMVSRLSNAGSAPVYSVLDQRRRKGRVMVDDVEIKNPATINSAKRSTLWHADVGYVFNGLGANYGLSIRTGKKTGSWADIGTSTQPATEVDLFAAWIQHTNLTAPLFYSIYPAVTYNQFLTKRKNTVLSTIKNDNSVSAVFHPGRRTAMFVFWNTTGGSCTFTPVAGKSSITVSSTAPVTVIFRIDAKELIVSNPSQSVTSAQIIVRNGATAKTIPFTFPTGGSAGASVTKKY